MRGDTRGPGDFVSMLWVHPDRVVLQEMVWAHLFPSFAAIIEEAPERCEDVYRVSPRVGKVWKYQGSQEQMMRYLSESLLFYGYDRVEMIGMDKNGDALDSKGEFTGLEGEGEGISQESHSLAIQQIRGFQKAWSEGEIARTQAVKKVAQIVRRDDNGLSFGDGALDALLEHVKGD